MTPDVSKMVLVRDDTQGWRYGASYVSWRGEQLADDRGFQLCTVLTPVWWAYCPACSYIALHKWQTLTRGMGCIHYHYTNLLVFKDQAACCSLWLMGGLQAVVDSIPPETKRACPEDRFPGWEHQTMREQL